MKPKSVQIFQVLGWITVGLAGILLLLFLMALGRYRVGVEDMLMLVLVLAGFAGLIVGTIQVALRRSATGRMIYLGGAGAVVLSLILGMAMTGGDAARGFLIMLVIGLLALVPSIIFLFQADTNGWLAQGPLPRPSPSTGAPFSQGGGYPTQQGGGYPPQQGGGWSPPPAQPYGAPPAQPYGAPPPAMSGGYPTGDQPAFAPPAPPEPSVYAPPPAPEPAFAPEPVAPAAAAPAADGTRTCPFCAEEIKVQAVKCRYCGSAVEPLAR